ncbi:FAD-dependent monooxygenase [Streptomyces sp. NPDC058371]|uniref:FAD-dependent monooxygenase n=1 Tax=Streptomyces sp. NPDC058371 TaxID=3346463 RepID=UPI003657E15E
MDSVMGNTETEYDVVVSGAGPVGLLLACELRLGGTGRVLVVERLPEVDETIKAGAVNTPTAVALDRRGMLPALAEVQEQALSRFRTFLREQAGGGAGAQAAPAPPPRFAGHFAGIMLSAGLFDESDPAFADVGPAAKVGLVPQAALERLLAKRAARLGVELRRNAEVTGFEASTDGVTVHIEHAAGSAPAADHRGPDRSGPQTDHRTDGAGAGPQTDHRTDGAGAGPQTDHRTDGAGSATDHRTDGAGSATDHRAGESRSETDHRTDGVGPEAVDPTNRPRPETGHPTDTPRSETVRAGWLVGCDGGRSTVRKLAGFEFDGTPPEITGHQAIVDMTGAEGLKSGWNTTETGTYAHGPVPGRILTVEFDGPPADRETPVTAEELQTSLRHVSGADVTVTKVHSATRFTDNARQAASYRAGRVLLAGDAAHVHSPFGGQGLNLGIGDAMNLGWKLAAAVRGDAPEGLLDSYTAERHPIGAWVLDWTRAQIALMRPDPHARALRKVVTDLVETVTGTTYLVRQISGVQQRYDLPGGHPLVGRSAPDLELADGGRLADRLHGGRGLLLDLADDPKLRARAEGYGDRVDVVTTGCPARPELTGLLVRPDGITAWAADGTSSGDPAHLEPTGQPGPTGPTGSTGSTGPTGPTGSTRSTGAARHPGGEPGDALADALERWFGSPVLR